MQWLVVGLGNPGTAYVNHRHNVGFWATEALWEQGIFSPWTVKKEARVSVGTLDDKAMILCCPQTYMNLSGRAVAAIWKQFPKAQLLVIHDELDINPGRVTFKQGGSARGHNGLKSIHDMVGADYARLRIGIGRPSEQSDVSRYVLSSCRPQEKELIHQAIQRAIQGIKFLVIQDEAACIRALKE